MLNAVDKSEKDALSLQYDEVMNLLTVAEELESTCGHGLIKVHLENLSAIWNEFRSTMFKNKSEGKEIGFSYSLLFNKYMCVSGKLSDMLISKPKINNEIASNNQFNLPRIQLPEFSGKPSEWRGFIALFDRMVHNNETINKGLKISHLKTRVKGAAAKIINHIDPTPDKYVTCYALLRKRFDNKREMLSYYIENILQFP